METLTEQQFIRFARPALINIFAKEDPYGESFSTAVPYRKILYPYEYRLEPPFSEALKAAASSLGEDGFFVSLLNRPSEEERRQPYHWYVPFIDLDQYFSFIGPLENVIYSPTGSWGIMCSDENHSLFGANLKIAQVVQSLQPDIDDQVFDFLDIWKEFIKHYGSTAEWMPNLLQHVYGEQRAVGLLEYFNEDP